VTVDDALIATRRSLHGIAEGVMAGPQYRASGTIRLAVSPAGFRTTKDPALRLSGNVLVTASGAELPLTGSFGALARSAGVDWGPPEGVYADHGGTTADDPILVDADAVTVLVGWLAQGDSALRQLVPDETPVLWPEHFDLALTLDEVNFGVSPGDPWSPEPYAYVGPWRQPEGEFWNAPFGAARPRSALPDEAAVLAFFLEARRRLATG